MPEVLARSRAGPAVVEVTFGEYAGLRQATLTDISELGQLESEVWGPEQAATAEMWLSRITAFPEGTIVACDEEGTICGVVSISVVHYDLSRPTPTWAEATDQGMIGNHDPTGNMAYGVTLTAHQKAPREASTALLVAAGRVVVRNRLEGIIVGSRLPFYKRYVGQMTAADYARLSYEWKPRRRRLWGGKLKPRSGRRFHPDPELVLYKKHSLEFVVVLEDYFEDPDSLNFGAILIWRNYFHQLPLPGFWAKLLTVRTAQGWRGFLPQKH